MSWYKFYPEGVTGVDIAYKDITPPNRNSVQELESETDIRRAFWNIQSSDWVVDVGAGFGAYTLAALARPEVRVFAFECDKELLTILRENLGTDKNKLLGLLERCSTNCIKIDSKENSIDKFLDKLSYIPKRIHWIKIDVDNQHDALDVLDGASNTVVKHLPNILIRAVDPPPNVSQIFKDLGYKVKELKGHTFFYR